ncbi:YktB family protein [Alicyclobacillus sp. SO9]|uniref:YktB family protein n=1 Tax=Alicyclobacillus sp. SO9 TaxID=2665646 RepID=UPI0018E841DB|nr:DUF1054 domain-containing protein [Alicyclobacillus sp. SO9]QQE79493.1 DUF1054 domain-containing protein [Alicyclobacillus sp. SO9]
MNFTGFEEKDFEVFEIPGLDNRMDALKQQVRPKFQEIGPVMAEYLEQLLNQPMYPHVARHARRTVNPPNDSWVAFCHDKRGYKKHPHFQIGLWQTHVFMNFGLIYESPQRQHYAKQLRDHAEEVLERIPQNYVWIPNHMDPNAVPASEVDAGKLDELATRLATVKQGELLVGRNIPKAEAAAMSGEELLNEAKACFKTLQPLYKLAAGEVVFV